VVLVMLVMMKVSRRMRIKTQKMLEKLKRILFWNSIIRSIDITYL